MSSNVQSEIASICKEWSKGLSRFSEDNDCIEYVRMELPNLLLNKRLFAEVLNDIVEGEKYPDPGLSTMFDNELLLHADPSWRFSLRLFLWGPGEYTIVHDHNSWGVIGPVSGVLEVFNYRREDDESQEGYAHMVKTKTTKCIPGETAFTLRLNQGIHNMGNPTKEAMISLAVYGKPLTRGYINGFDVERNRAYKIFPPKAKKKTLAKQALPGLTEVVHRKMSFGRKKEALYPRRPDEEGEGLTTPSPKEDAMNMIDQLASIPLFQSLPVEHIKDLATIVVRRTFRKGQTIFSEGDEGNSFYVVVSGRVKIFKCSSEGKEQILHIFSPWEPFGEVPVFSGENFPAHAEALEESGVFFFPREAFIGLIRRNPSLALNMLAVLSRRLRKFTVLIEDLSLKEVPGRLAAHLLYLSERKEGTGHLVLDISKGQLASLLGTIPETLSRILSRMSREELIRSNGPRCIQILDREGLEGMASGERRLS